MPVEIKISVDDREIRSLLSRFQARLRDLTPAMKIVGEIVQTSVLRNFEAGGRPQKWAPLKASTILQRLRQGHWPGQILVRHGVSGGLMGSISYRAYNDRAVVSANKKYAAIHQFGGKAGRGLKANIPARPYLLIQDADWTEIQRALSEYLSSGGRGSA